MKKILSMLAVMMMAGGALTGCGNACDDLADTLEACFPDATTGDGEAGECTDEAATQAECIDGKLDDTCSNFIEAATECAGS